MKSLDEAVQKFKSLKQKLKLISQQPSKQSKYSAVPKFTKADKQNLLNFQNTQHIQTKHKYIPDGSKQIRNSRIGQNVIQKTSLNLKSTKIFDQKQIFQEDHKNQTQKKGQHKKNKSWNYSNTQNAGKLQEKQIETNNEKYKKDSSCERYSIKVGSLNNSRLSQQYSRQLKSKEKTLNQINELLQKKKQVLQTLERKLGTSYLQDSKFSQNYTKSKRAIRAPNLFQMQNQARKRSKSKPLTIRWK